MGLDISIKGYGKTYHGGWNKFNLYRIKVAKAYNKELGLMYNNAIMMKRDLSEAEAERWNELCNDDLDLLLWNIDYDNKLKWQQCREIYKVLSKLDVRMSAYNYGEYKTYDMHELWLNMFKYCWRHRVTMYFN